MSVVIEFTLHTVPGHYEQALSIYMPWVEGLEAQVDGLELVITAGDVSNGTLRGVGVYESAQIAESLASQPYFAQLIDALEPHLASAPERVELDLLEMHLSDDALSDLSDAALVEIEMRAKLGHVNDLIAAYTGYVDRFQQLVPDARMLLETTNAASGEVRGLIVYEHRSRAEEYASSPFLTEMVDSLAPLLAAPLKRTEFHLIHLFVRN